MSGFNRGRLRHKVRLEQLVDALDSNGEVIQDQSTGAVERTWVLVSSPWAAIEPLSAREFVAASATQSKVTTRITISYRPGVTAAMRIVHNGTVYNIEGTLADRDSGTEYLTLPCSQGASSEGI